MGSDYQLLKCFEIRVETLSGFLNASCGDRAGFVSHHIMCRIVCQKSQLECQCRNTGGDCSVKVADRSEEDGSRLMQTMCSWSSKLVFHCRNIQQVFLFLLKGEVEEEED